MGHAVMAMFATMHTNRLFVLGLSENNTQGERKMCGVADEVIQQMLGLG